MRPQTLRCPHCLGLGPMRVVERYPVHDLVERQGGDATVSYTRIADRTRYECSVCRTLWSYTVPRPYTRQHDPHDAA